MRDDFRIPVKRALAQRAAHFCSNPRCLRLTVGPHSNSARALLSGHAAHIRAASPNGPRYDPSQSAEERSSIENGIWLCRECGVIADNDEDQFTVEGLFRWKADHEAMVDEIRQKGYSQSLALLQHRQAEPQAAKAILDVIQDKRAFWENFDIENPDRVRRSLDRTREELTNIKSRLPTGAPLDTFLETMTRTIRAFFRRMESIDLISLKCSSMDPDWVAFSDALYALRKAVGMQVGHLVDAFSFPISEEIRLILPLALAPTELQDRQ